jgi:hypothetical protein
MASQKSEMLDHIQEETKTYGEKGKKRKRARQGSKPDLQCPREESKVEKVIEEVLADCFGNNKTQTELTLFNSQNLKTQSSTHQRQSWLSANSATLV